MALERAPGFQANDHGRLPEPTIAGFMGALISSASPSNEITAIGAASPWRTLASL